MERSLIICVVFFIGFSYAAVLPNQKGKDKTSLLIHQVILEKKHQIYCVMTCFKTPLCFNFDPFWIFTMWSFSHFR